MERPVFNPARVKFSPEAAAKFEDKPKNSVNVNWGNPQPSSIYAGTANPNQVAKRRAKNKVASHSRKKNRRRSK